MPWVLFLDFVNDPAKVLEDFQLYYKSASLPDNVDPSILFEVANDLDAAGIYTEADIDAVAEIYFKTKDTIGAIRDNDQPATSQSLVSDRPLSCKRSIL
ncbi:hypothetical protein VVR85_09180 [Corynebacterium sp. LK2590]|uniref:hypothetical protein n=1 Tax=unclassified Corynebacterium TaxID=2624378 RepID=UPI0034CEB3D2